MHGNWLSNTDLLKMLKFTKLREVRVEKTHPSVLWTGLLKDRGTVNGCGLGSPVLRLSEKHRKNKKGELKKKTFTCNKIQGR